MKNKVIVSRAPRLNLVSMMSIQCGTYCCDPRNGEIYYTQNNSFVRIEMSGLFGLATHYWVDAGDCFTKMMVHTFGSFDDVCKWVANGRKLEDLCSHVEELVDYESLSPGQYFTNGDHVYMKIYASFVGICDKAPGLIPKTQVWPLRAGDAITIEITE